MKAVMKVNSVIFICIFFLWLFPCGIAEAKNDQEIEAEIPVSCVQLPERKDYVYSIMMEADNMNFPRPKNEYLQLMDGETGNFQIDITEPGTYLYKIYQKQGKEQEIEYDSSVYLVTVFVVDDQKEGLIYSVSAKIDGKNNKPDELKFCNTVLSNSSEFFPDSKSQHIGVMEEVMKFVQTGEYISWKIFAAVIIISAGIALILRKKQTNS